MSPSSAKISGRRSSRRLTCFHRYPAGLACASQSLKVSTLNHPEEYAGIISKANPAFIDVKAFTPEASAARINDRLRTSNNVKSYVPTFKEMEEFAEQLSAAGNFPILEQVERSKDILLACSWPDEKSIRIEAP